MLGKGESPKDNPDPPDLIYYSQHSLFIVLVGMVRFDYGFSRMNLIMELINIYEYSQYTRTHTYTQSHSHTHTVAGTDGWTDRQTSILTGKAPPSLQSISQSIIKFRLRPTGGGDCFHVRGWALS